jgi:hypothetical protein
LRVSLKKVVATWFPGLTMSVADAYNTYPELKEIAKKLIQNPYEQTPTEDLLSTVPIKDLLSTVVKTIDEEVKKTKGSYSKVKPKKTSRLVKAFKFFVLKSLINQTLSTGESWYQSFPNEFYQHTSGPPALIDPNFAYGQYFRNSSPVNFENGVSVYTNPTFGNDYVHTNFSNFQSESSGNNSPVNFVGNGVPVYTNQTSLNDRNVSNFQSKSSSGNNSPVKKLRPTSVHGPDQTNYSNFQSESSGNNSPVYTNQTARNDSNVPNFQSESSGNGSPETPNTLWYWMVNKIDIPVVITGAYATGSFITTGLSFLVYNQ